MFQKAAVCTTGSNVIVESYTNSKTVEQKAMFTIYKVLSKTHVHTLQQFDCQIVAKCEHEFYSTLYKV